MPSCTKIPFGLVVLQNVAPADPPVPCAAAKPARKAPAKPKPEHATKITTARDQNKKPLEGVASSTTALISRKKAVNTLTTVLTARSKVSDEANTSYFIVLFGNEFSFINLWLVTVNVVSSRLALLRNLK